MAPGAILVAADVSAGQRRQPLIAEPRRRKSWLRRGLPSLIAGSGLRVEHVEPIRAVAHIADATLVAARNAHRPAGACRRFVPQAAGQWLPRAIIVPMPDPMAPVVPAHASEAPDELVDTVLAASRALVAVAARSLAAAGDEVTLPQYRALVVRAAKGPQ